MKVVLVGAGAQAKYALEIFRFYQDCHIIGLIDIMNNPDFWGHAIGPAKVLGDLSVLESLIENKEVDAALICAGDTVEKEKLWHKVQRLGVEIVSAIHPKALIAETAQLSKGIIVNAGAVIQPFARIGKGVMIHAGVIVEHDNVIEDFANLAPGVKLAGWVRVGKRATVFTGACVIPQVTIGADAVVGAGAVVIQDVPPRATVVGVPARVIKYNNKRDG